MAIVLNVARRKALYQLASEITGYMRSELELDDNEKYDRPSPASPGSGPGSPSPGSAADLFAVPPSDNGSETDVNASQKQTPPSRQLIALRKAALAHFDQWRKDFLTRLKEIVASPDDNKLLEERRKRQEKLAQKKLETPTEGENLIDFGVVDAVIDQNQDQQHSVASVQALYHPIPTRLTTIAEDDRKEVLSAVLILLLSSGNYSAYSRTFVAYLTSAFELPLSVLINEETEVAKTMIEASAEAEKAKSKEGMSAEAEAEKRKQENQSSRYWKVGLASVAGAAVIGITGGLAAPVVAGAIGGLMGTVGLGGLASFLGIFWMNGALVGALFGAYGARMTGEMVDKYAREVEDFKFLPLKDEWGSEYAKDDNQMRRLRVTIGINGWLKDKEEVTKPWRVLGDESEVFALRYEMNSLMKLGTALKDLVSSYAWGYVKSEIIKRTVLATLWSALWPLSILKMASNLDNPFSLARNRSEKAGMILADALINKIQGERPVTLVGYSLGARVIYSCLKSLAERKAFGLVDTVVLIGAPVPSNRNHWQMMRSVVGGKMFNVYSENDFILAFMYRATSIQLGIAGLQEIQDIEGVNNLNLSEKVQGHLRYPDLIAPILTQCGFPNIKGGEKPIEKEEETSIQLQDSDRGSGQMGTLIDFGDKAKEAPEPVAVKPLGRSHREIAFPSGIERTNSGSRPVVTKAKTEPLAAADYEPLGPSGKAPAVEQKVLVGPKNPSLPPRPTGETARTISEPPPPYTPGPYGGLGSSFDEKPNEHVDTDEDDDEHGGGISMVDNDSDDGDMVTYMEPLRLEDRE